MSQNAAISNIEVTDEAVKKAHPDALVCFAQNGYFELYGKDAEKAAPLLGTKLLEKKVRGKPSMPVTGFRESAWVAGSHKLWKSGADVFLSKDGETLPPAICRAEYRNFAAKPASPSRKRWEP